MTFERPAYISLHGKPILATNKRAGTSVEKAACATLSFAQATSLVTAHTLDTNGGVLMR